MFEWWSPYILSKRDVIISDVEFRVKRKTHKYGIEVPTSIKDTFHINRENGNTFWTNDLSKDMGNVAVD